MVPLFAGVIIAGLGIGALLSAVAARHAPATRSSPAPLVVLHTPTPAAEPPATTAPVTARPRAVHVAVRTTPKPTPPQPTLAPTRAPKAPAPTVTPAATPKISEREPTPTPTETVKAVARAPQPIATPADRQTFYARTLVRRFLEAVAHGDDTAAYAALGETSGTLDEARYLDPTTQITSLSATRNNDGGTDVQVEMRTSRGQYFGTFSVDASGTKITEHEVIPVGGTTAR
jgi:outer membrane biosynthesis protein TonB